jgi:site-specific recombinase XerD
MTFKHVKDGEFTAMDMINADSTIDSFEKHLDAAQEAMDNRELNVSANHLYECMKKLVDMNIMTETKAKQDAALRMLENGNGIATLSLYRRNHFG